MLAGVNGNTLHANLLHADSATAKSLVDHCLLPYSPRIGKPRVRRWYIQ